MDNVLEVFGYNGEYHTLDYVKYARQLEVWEISQDCEAQLKSNLPGATIKITDSYREIKETKKLYDTIIIDNHQGVFGNDKCEHFEIIESCFQKLSNKGVIIANVIPDMMVSKYQTSDEMKVLHMVSRRRFYSHKTGTSIDLEYFKEFYEKMANKNGFIMNHMFFVKRNYLVSYMVLCLEKGRDVKVKQYNS